MTKWLVFEGAKSHLVCDQLAQLTIDDLVDRGAKLESAQTVDGKNVTFDLPGMVCTDRPWEVFNILNVGLEIPSEDVASFIYELQRLPLRKFSDGTPFYKLHGFHRCVVLTPNNHRLLLTILRDNVEMAEQRASEFYAVRKLPSQVLREAAAMANNEPLADVPNLGGNKQDRFKPKGGGGQLN